jgi:hypothetical protein
MRAELPNSVRAARARLVQQLRLPKFAQTRLPPFLPTLGVEDLKPS